MEEALKLSSHRLLDDDDDDHKAIIVAINTHQLLKNNIYVNFTTKQSSTCTNPTTCKLRTLQRQAYQHSHHSALFKKKYFVFDKITRNLIICHTTLKRN